MPLIRPRMLGFKRSHIECPQDICAHPCPDSTQQQHLLSDLQKMVVTALVLFKLGYYNALYINMQQRLLNKLHVLLNAVVRMLLGIPKYLSASQALVQLHWHLIRKHIDFKALCIALKAMYDSGPEYLKRNFTWYIPSRMLRSSSAYNLVIATFKRSHWGSRSFVHCTAKLYHHRALSI
ncbi:hypothetical protein NDU88_004491 [Pleurodeles waltl]|uniref:Uncharacterized protein n=1 Tax=Pleurodeles waltl TaxID=8319 RepID=A0AAV7NMT9_PLEWA|nr:hypothetical protein NDU88_004491 [Pleurodeles waltl]